MAVPDVEVVPYEGVNLIGQKEGSGQAESFARILDLLANRSRLTIVAMLRVAGDKGASVSEFVAALQLSQPTVSHHLRHLIASGVVNATRNGVFNVYTLNHGVARQVVDALAEVLLPGGRARRK